MTAEEWAKLFRALLDKVGLVFARQSGRDAEALRQERERNDEAERIRHARDRLERGDIDRDRLRDHFRPE